MFGNGLCLEGVMYRRGFVQRGFVRGGFVQGGFVRRGFCPRTRIYNTNRIHCLRTSNLTFLNLQAIRRNVAREGA